MSPVAIALLRVMSRARQPAHGDGVMPLPFRYCTSRSFVGKLLHQQVATPDVAVVDASFYLERPVGSHAPYVLGLDEGA